MILADKVGRGGVGQWTEATDGGRRPSGIVEPVPEPERAKEVDAEITESAHDGVGV
ncbi:hypothetical protein RKD23_007646 [Streptomyces sp. SAI-170]